MKNIVGGSIGVALTGVMLLGGSAGVASAAPAAGPIKIFVTPQLSGTGGTIVLTGAVGDGGKTLSVTSSGKTSATGNYERLLLKQGTMLVNATQFNAAVNSSSAAPTDYNAATCSATIVTSGPATVVSGTKAYAGATGTITLTATFAFVLPRTKSGTCNMANSAKPVAQWASITGTGNISF
jgi:hypothetical protein